LGNEHCWVAMLDTKPTSDLGKLAVKFSGRV
jgi:hypothetical protein